MLRICVSVQYLHSYALFSFEWSDTLRILHVHEMLMMSIKPESWSIFSLVFALLLE